MTWPRSTMAGPVCMAWSTLISIVMCCSAAAAGAGGLAPSARPDLPTTAATSPHSDGSTAVAPPALMAELRAAEQAQRGPNAPTAERAAAAGRADELRSKLLAAAPNDDNAPTWLIDRAAYALAGLAADGADASALFGVCTRGQRERIAEVAAQALAMLDRAAAAAANSTQRLESSLLDRSLAPEAAKARATEVEPLLARLVDVEQGVRIPFHRATAQVLLASASDNPARRASLTTSAVTALGGFSFPAAGAESTRLTLVAAADMLATTGPAVSPSPPPAQPPGDRRKPTDRPATPPAPSVVADSLERAYALATSRSSASETDGTAQGNLAAALWARMGLLALGLRDPAAGAPHSTHDTWRTRLLLAEAVASAGTRSGRNAATAGAGSRIATSPAAEAARLGPLLAIAREVGAAEDQADRLFIYAKIAAATSPATPFSSLDPELAFARAVTIARDSLTGAPSPPASAPAPSGATKPAAAPISAVSIEALALFRQVAEREPPPDAPEDLRPRALWESAVLLSQSTDPTDQSAAIRTLHRLFTSHGKSPFAPKAAARVAALAPQACGKASQSLAGVDV